MTTRILLVLPFMLAATSAVGVLPGTDLYLPSVGRLQGECPGNPPVCALWRTTVWVYNPSTTDSATVDVAFLARGDDNRTPLTEQILVGPGASQELGDLFQSLFHINDVKGALRFTSDRPVVVTGRIYDENVQTNKGSGTAGQFFRGADVREAIGTGESVDLIGLAQDDTGAWRTNFGFVETTGQTCTVTVQAFDGLGTALGGARTFSVLPFSQLQPNIQEIQGGPGENRRLRVSVTEGSGKVLAFGSRIDNRTGDPSTVEMAGQGRDGEYVGTLDKATYDTPISFTVAGGAVTRLDTTVLVTAEDVGTCQGGELFRLEGPLAQPVVLEDGGGFSFVASASISGVSVSLQIDGAITVNGTLSGTVETTVSNAGPCSGSKSWPMAGARQP